MGGRPRYNKIPKLAVRVVPRYEAEIVAEVLMRTMDVLTVKFALVAPAGTVTLEGTLAAPLLLESMICAPPEGAGPLNVTVPVEDPKPPITLEGCSVNDERVAGGGGAGVTVREADLLVPLKIAEMVMAVEAATELVPTANDALLAPAAIVTLDGTLATEV